MIGKGVALYISLFGTLLATPALSEEANASWPSQAGWTATGTRVRVTAPSVSDRPIEGWIEEWRTDSLLIVRDPGPLVSSFPRLSITRLETSEGMKGDAVRGSVVGLLLGIPAGLLVGGVAAAIAGGGNEGDAEAAYFLGWLSTVAGGAIAGAIIGGNDESEQWEEVYAR